MIYHLFPGPVFGGKVSLLELQNQNQALQDAVARAKQRIESLEQDNRSLQAQNSVQQQVEQLESKEQHAAYPTSDEISRSPAQQGMAEPPWMSEWRQRTTFERDATLPHPDHWWDAHR